MATYRLKRKLFGLGGWMIGKNNWMNLKSAGQQMVNGKMVNVNKAGQALTAKYKAGEIAKGIAKPVLGLTAVAAGGTALAGSAIKDAGKQSDGSNLNL